MGRRKNELYCYFNEGDWFDGFQCMELFKSLNCGVDGWVILQAPFGRA